MSVFGAPDYDDHELVEFVRDARTGLHAIIAVHSTARGPSLGGCRMYPYTSETEAIADVLRLSRGMSYKAAVADVALGGGKSVIIANPAADKSDELLQSMGRAIDRLGGRYITGEDIGTRPSDMAIMRRETRCVSCLETEDGGYGDPAIFTALGVAQAIRAGCKFAFDTEELKGIRVAVQGVGNVGHHLCRLLHAAGASLVICDPLESNLKKVADLKPDVVAVENIFNANVDVFAPCAVGAVLNDDSIPLLNARVVAGAANNQLSEARHAELLADSGILYVPDYVANGGGLISCEAEWYQTDRSLIEPRVKKIYDTCCELIQNAADNGITTGEAADLLAQKKISAATQART